MTELVSVPARKLRRGQIIRHEDADGVSRERVVFIGDIRSDGTLMLTVEPVPTGGFTARKASEVLADQPFDVEVSDRAVADLLEQMLTLTMGAGEKFATGVTRRELGGDWSNGETSVVVESGAVLADGRATVELVMFSEEGDTLGTLSLVTSDTPQQVVLNG